MFAILATRGGKALSQSAGEAQRISNHRVPFTAVSSQSEIEARSTERRDFLLLSRFLTLISNSFSQFVSCQLSQGILMVY